MTYINDADFQLYVGDVREQLRNLPAESVHCVVTSPPYWGLRDYGTGVWDGGDPDCDHVERTPSPRKNFGTARGRTAEFHDRDRIRYGGECGKCGARRVDQQLGLEPTPDLYVQNMVDVFREVRRVLRRDGTCWINLGDAFGNKQLYGMPWKVAFALQADGWYLRADVIWAKPNPMPESVTDRPTKAHEYLFLLTRSPRYFYDADAIREPAEWARWGDQTNRKHEGSGSAAGWITSKTKNELTGDRRKVGFNARWDASEQNGTAPTGRNRRSVWEIATEPYPDAHFATFPQALVEPCILAGTSERGCCPECGAPWEREVDREPRPQVGTADHVRSGRLKAGGLVSTTRKVGQEYQDWLNDNPPRTTGWRPTCECVASQDIAKAVVFSPDPCTVLDPFMGSGTTALVARRFGRKAIGVELNEEYARLCAHRLHQLSLLA